MGAASLATLWGEFLCVQLQGQVRVAVAGHFGLTNRQTEVLHLLAKGRNAAYIQKQLVISQHTAKAHIYSIYKKTETHSQQDLMDLVENWEGEGRR